MQRIAELKRKLFERKRPKPVIVNVYVDSDDISDRACFMDSFILAFDEIIDEVMSRE